MEEPHSVSYPDLEATYPDLGVVLLCIDIGLEEGLFTHEALLAEAFDTYGATAALVKRAFQQFKSYEADHGRNGVAELFSRVMHFASDEQAHMWASRIMQWHAEMQTPDRKQGTSARSMD